PKSRPRAGRYQVASADRTILAKPALRADHLAGREHEIALAGTELSGSRFPRSSRSHQGSDTPPPLIPLQAAFRKSCRSISRTCRARNRPQAIPPSNNAVARTLGRCHRKPLVTTRLSPHHG